MKDRLNLGLGLLSSVWVAIVSFVVVPFYLRFLGLEAYGLIGFFVALQSLFVVLDMGLSATMSREVARCRAHGANRDACNLLHTLQYIYWATAVVIGIGIALAAGFIAEHWLRDTGIPRADLRDAIVLMGLVIGLRWPVALYSGALIGAQRLSVVSILTIIMSTVTNLGAVLVLWQVSASIEAFFAWQALCALLHAASLYVIAWREMGERANVLFDKAGLLRIWRFSGGLSIAALTGVIFMQSDKLVLARLVSLTELGGYMLAATMARALYIVLTPAFNVIYPKMTALLADGTTAELATYYRVGTRLLVAAIVPASTFASFFSYELLMLWTGDAAVAALVAPIVPLIVAGTVLNGVMHFPYALQLAAGNSRLPATINLILLVLFVPMLIVLASSFGIYGGALAWLGLNSCYILLGTWLTHRTILPGLGARWILQDVGVPFLLCAGVSAAGAVAARAPDLPVLVQLGLGAASAGVALLLCLVILTPSASILPSTRLRLVTLFKPSPRN